MRLGVIGAVCRFGLRLMFPLSTNVGTLMYDIQTEKAKREKLDKMFEETGN